MLLCSSPPWTQTRAWFQDYDNVQRLAVLFLYIQIACSLIGSIGALYTGELVVNLLVALFALVAIESGSQILSRTYALLLACTILLDITWFILFSNEIRRINSQKYGNNSVFSVRIVFWMQIVGFSVRFLSSSLWFQMYRLGESPDNASVYQPLDLESRTNLLTPVSRSPTPSRQISISDEVLGGSIYNPAYYSTLFQGRGDNGEVYEDVFEKTLEEIQEVVDKANKIIDNYDTSKKDEESTIDAYEKNVDMLQVLGMETPPKVTSDSVIA